MEKKLCLGVHLQLTPINYVPNFFLALEVHVHPLSTPMRNCRHTLSLTDCTCWCWCDLGQLSCSRIKLSLVDWGRPISAGLISPPKPKGPITLYTPLYSCSVAPVDGTDYCCCCCWCCFSCFWFVLYTDILSIFVMLQPQKSSWLIVTKNKLLTISGDTWNWWD